MSKQAAKYINPEKVPHIVIADMNSSHNEQLDGNKDQPESLKELLESSRGIQENSSVISEKSEASSEQSNDQNEEQKNSIILQGDQGTSLGNLRQLSVPTLYTLSSVLRKAASQKPHSTLVMETIQGRQRMSTIDPSTLRKLKSIKLDELKEDDQIELAVLILQKESEDRTPTDLNFLVKCTENVAFFKKYDEETHRECMAKVYHVHLKKGDTCIKHGEYGETFWITLKGTVSIHIPIEKEIVEKKIERGVKVRHVRKEKVPTKVAAQGAGYAFGELSLLERKPRAATVVCEEDSDFAVLDKEHFQQILREKEERILFNEVNFLKSLKIFTHWSYNSLRTLFMYSKLKNAVRNQAIYSQNEPPHAMYVIKTGEFKMTAKIHYDNEQNSTDITIKKYLKKQPPAREVELSILGPGEIFGVEDIISNKNRTTSVVCISLTGQIVEINSKEVINLILPEQTASAWLKGYINSRGSIHKKRMASIVSNTKNVQNLLMRSTSTKRDANWLAATSEMTEPTANTQEQVFIPRRNNPTPAQDSLSSYKKVIALKEAMELSRSKSIRQNARRLRSDEAESEPERQYLSKIRDLEDIARATPLMSPSPLRNRLPVKILVPSEKDKPRHLKVYDHHSSKSISMRSNFPEDTLSLHQSPRMQPEIKITESYASAIEDFSPERNVEMLSKIQPFPSVDGGEISSSFPETTPFAINDRTSPELTISRQKIPRGLEDSTISKTILDAETQDALRKKLRLNTLQLSHLEKKDQPKYHPTLYNQMITGSLSARNSKEIAEKPSSTIVIRFKKRINEIKEPTSTKSSYSRLSPATPLQRQLSSKSQIRISHTYPQTGIILNNSLTPQQKTYMMSADKYIKSQFSGRNENSRWKPLSVRKGEIDRSFKSPKPFLPNIDLTGIGNGDMTNVSSIYMLSEGAPLSLESVRNQMSTIKIQPKCRGGKISEGYFKF